MKLGIETTNFHKYLYVEDDAKRRYFTLEEIKNKPQNFVQSVNYRLNKQAEQIRSLEEQLKNAILLPKFEKGEKVYYICSGKIVEGYYQNIMVDASAEVILNPKEVVDEDGETWGDFDVDMVEIKRLCRTREEALNRLAELEGRSDD